MKKIAVIILCILLLTPAFTSCASQDIYVDDIKDETPLSIYLLEANDWADDDGPTLIGDHIKQYGYKKEEGLRDIEITWFASEDIGAMYERIKNEMTLGKGPDLILIEPNTCKYLDLYKMDGLADMDRLIANSESFNLEEYNQLVMDAGIINGTRVMIPWSYMFYLFEGHAEAFERCNVSIPDELTMESYCHMLEEFYQKVEHEPAMFGVPNDEDWIEANLLYPQFLELGELLESSEEFKKLVDLMKVEYQRKMNQEQVEFRDYDNRFYSSNSVLRRYGDYFSFYGLHTAYNFTVLYYEKEMLLLKQPLREGMGVNKANVQWGMAININSVHKNEAFKLIEYLLSTNIQNSRVKMIDLPVNIKGFEKQARLFKKGYGPNVSLEHLIPNQTAIPEALRNEHMQFIESADTCEYIGDKKYIYYNIMWPSIEGYYNDLMTFDQMIDEINNKLEIYYTE